MKNSIRSIFLLAICSIIGNVSLAQYRLNVAKEIKYATAQYKFMLSNLGDRSDFPQSISPDGKLKTMSADWWCSGFFGGSLWYLYEYTKDSSLKKAAEKWTTALEKQQFNTSTHDLGFMLYCSYGNGYRLTGSDEYKHVLLVGAKSLASRFDPNYGVIKSWDNWKSYNYPVIIDNMMNLEFLIWASKASGDSSFYKISVSHADQTIKNHFRRDYSSYHVVCYGEGGIALKKATHQGYSDSSAWARGQAWGLYGYTMMYRETKKIRYLKQAEAIAKFLLKNPGLPKDKIPYWDFNAPDLPRQEKDASAGAVMASALLELSQYTNKANKALYFHVAEKMLNSLSGPKYKTKPRTNYGFLLLHSVGSKPFSSEVNTPIIYADYYYIEALLRYDKILKKEPLYNN